MVIMNSPGNPSGSVYSREELEAIVEVAAEEDIYILSDEIYEKLVYDDAKHVSIASLSKQAYDLTITVNGFSKSYAMTGWRLGYMGAPEAIAKAVDSIQSHSTSNPCSFAQKGAIAALKGDQQPLSDMHDEFDMRRNYMFDRISKIANITAVKPRGAFYVLVNISQLGLNSQNFADRLLSKANVAVIPGAAFGDDRTIRLSYATSIDVIKKGLDRFQDFCRTLLRRSPVIPSYHSRRWEQTSRRLRQARTPVAPRASTPNDSSCTGPASLSVFSPARIVSPGSA
jgi:aspartate aminotransferase